MPQSLADKSLCGKLLYKDLSSQAYAHVFSANFALDCVKNPCRAASPPADFCLVLDKIMLENPHTFLVKTGSKRYTEGESF